MASYSHRISCVIRTGSLQQCPEDLSGIKIFHRQLPGGTTFRLIARRYMFDGLNSGDAIIICPKSRTARKIFTEARVLHDGWSAHCQIASSALAEPAAAANNVSVLRYT